MNKIKQSELNKSIQKVADKVREETLIKVKSEEERNNFEIINPYKILGISENETHPDYREKKNLEGKIILIMLFIWIYQEE